MVQIYGQPFAQMEAAHIFPTSLVQEWNRNTYRERWIADRSPAARIGETRLYSPQNGLLLATPYHGFFDSFQIGIDPDV